MSKTKNLTLTQSAELTGLSRSRISQLIHGYEHKGRGERYLALLKEELHWRHEVRRNRMHTVITPDGIEVLRRVKRGEVQQKKAVEKK